MKAISISRTFKKYSAKLGCVAAEPLLAMIHRPYHIAMRRSGLFFQSVAQFPSPIKTLLSKNDGARSIEKFGNISQLFVSCQYNNKFLR